MYPAPDGSSHEQTKTAKTKSKKENLAALGLPALGALPGGRGDRRARTKKFLVRRIEALAAPAVEPAPAEEPLRRRAPARARDVGPSPRRRSRNARRRAARSVRVDDD